MLSIFLIRDRCLINSTRPHSFPEGQSTAPWSFRFFIQATAMSSSTPLLRTFLKRGWTSPDTHDTPQPQTEAVLERSGKRGRTHAYRRWDDNVAGRPACFPEPSSRYPNIAFSHPQEWEGIASGLSPLMLLRAKSRFLLKSPTAKSQNGLTPNR